MLPSYEGEGDLYQSFSRAAISSSAQIQHPAFGSEYQLGDAVVEVVGPLRSDYLLENDRSLALRITYSFIVNVIWFLVNGWWMALGNFVIGCVWCITIVGIPFGKQFFKIAKLSLRPFGSYIVRV